MKTKHTPGPWRVGDAGATIFGPPNGNTSPETIASGIRNRNNAKLIAAAPELLLALLTSVEMLQECQRTSPCKDQVETIASVIQTAQAAIAKATA